MKLNFLEWGSILLLLLCGGLFVVAFHMNQLHHVAAIRFIHADMDEALTREADQLNTALEHEESQLFALFDQPSPAVSSQCRLFRVQRPGASSFGQFSQFLEAGENFQRSLDAARQGNLRQARVHWEAALQAVSTNVAGKEAAPKIEPVGTIPSGTTNTLVTEIELLLKGRALPFRIMVGREVLSVNAKGRAALFPLPKERKKEAAFRVECTLAQPTDADAAVVKAPAFLTGVWLWIGRASVAAKEQRATNQYRLAQLLLGVILLMAVCVVIGLTLTLRRERELARIRTAFLSTVSHDLRTPLSLIRLYTETLLERRVPEGKIDHYFRTIIGETERLTGLVNNVVDFSRIERQSLEVRLESVNLTALCEKVTEVFQQRLTQEGIVLTLNLAAGVIARADSMAVTQVLFNLLDNAIKYSADDKRVDITLAQAEGQALRLSSGQVRISVADHGIGIPDAHKKRIFEGFFRGTDPRVTAKRGSGIGLSVTRYLVRKMNGTIRVDDNQPTGTVLTVVLPAGSDPVQEESA